MAGALVCLMVVLAGCTLRGSSQSSLPPPPKVEAVKPPADTPLSIPQTAASLNIPREWNAAAVPGEPPAEPPAPPKVEVQAESANSRKTAAPPAKTLDPAGTVGTAAPQETEEEPTPAPPAATDTAPFQPIMPAEQQATLKNAILNRRRVINNLLNKANEHGGNDKTQVERIKSFLNLADDAEKRGDYTQADSLCEKALALAQDLKVE